MLFGSDGEGATAGAGEGIAWAGASGILTTGPVGGAVGVTGADGLNVVAGAGGIT